MATTDIMDWPTVVRTYHEVFDGRRWTGPHDAPKAPGRNMITEEWLGYVNVDGLCVEISTGVFLSKRLIGVSFPDREDPRSDCFESLAEAYDHLYPNDYPKGP